MVAGASTGAVLVVGQPRGRHAIEQGTDQLIEQTHSLLLRAMSVLLLTFAFGFGGVRLVQLWAR